jgi:3-oxoadipate enol-lactonase
MELHIESNGAQIGYQLEGPPEAPALLLVNAIGTTTELWARQVPGLRAAFRVIRYDTRGHGRSSVPPGEYTMDQLGRDAVAVLDAAGVKEAYVCGLSLGGLTAMWMGIHAPERVAGLILANTSARIGTTQSWTERIALVRERGMGAVADIATMLWFTPEFRVRDADTVHGFRAMLQQCAPEGYTGCCAALRDTDLRDRIGAIRGPVLVIGGRVDRSTPLDASELICASIPGARLLTLEAAHLSNVEQADAFTTAVTEFIGLPVLGAGL